MVDRHVQTGVDALRIFARFVVQVATSDCSYRKKLRCPDEALLEREEKRY
jgi:hypothetical protein